MSHRFYTGQGVVRPEPTGDLPRSRHMEWLRAEGYLADPGLVDAVNVALTLCLPLLLTGEPGTGKTELARSVAAELGLGEPLRFDTKSTSTARDLFYTFDAVRRFHAANFDEGSQRTPDYLTYNALGLAILYSNAEEELREVTPTGFRHPGRRRSVVLIDEIDKAPRDFPNDILAELENLYFQVPELGSARIQADPGMQPIVIMTSNSEKHLPDAFLRRCVYYDIPFPERDRLEAILSARFGPSRAAEDGFVGSVLDLFYQLRSDTAGLRKRPATAELLAWIRMLKALDPGSPDPLREQPQRALETLGALVKTREDQARARRLVEAWIAQRS